MLCDSPYAPVDVKGDNVAFELMKHVERKRIYVTRCYWVLTELKSNDAK